MGEGERQAAERRMAEVREAIRQDPAATVTALTEIVAEAASSANQIAGTISGVARSSQVTDEGVAQIRTAADDLARMSSRPQQIVSRFRVA